MPFPLFFPILGLAILGFQVSMSGPSLMPKETHPAQHCGLRHPVPFFWSIFLQISALLIFFVSPACPARQGLGLGLTCCH
jgi:hypothetical protein